MKKQFGILVSLTLLLSSCLRLDSNFFNNSDKISSYKWDNYTGEREIPNLPSSYRIPDSLFHELKLVSDDNGNKASISAVYLGDLKTIASDTVILYCHGNKFHMDLYWNRAKLLAYTGGLGRFGVMMMDYRGYGLSEGEPSESGLQADVIACLKWLKENGLKSENLILYGFSLGSSPATKLAIENPVMPAAKLVLEAPFASAQALTEDAAKLSLPGSYFTNIKVDNESTIRNLKIPFCLFHGRDDDFLRYEAHGKRVFEACPDSPGKEQHVVPAAVHNNLPAVMGFETYSQTLLNFIRK
jgi:pimeloyl-ACP methyl ester carboxylesterase